MSLLEEVFDELRAERNGVTSSPCLLTEDEMAPVEQSANRPAHWFKPGVSGNPHGRPAGTKGLVKRLKEITNEGEALIQFAWDVMNGTALEFDMGNGEKVKIPPKWEHRIEAHQWLADRLWGKSMQKIEDTGERRAYVIGLLREGRDPLAEPRQDDERVLDVKALPEAGE